MMMTVTAAVTKNVNNNSYYVKWARKMQVGDALIVFIFTFTLVQSGLGTITI